MSQHIVRITKQDPLTVQWPSKGKTKTWLEVKYGGSDQLWIDREAAENLMRQLGQLLNEPAVPQVAGHD